MSKQAAVALLMGIIILGVGLRSYQLTSRSLWFDEAFSWRLIQFPLTELVARDAQDVHPPLYYLILKGWSVVFGSSLLALRSFSVTAAAATMGAGYLFVSSATKSRGAGLVAAAFLALSGWQIQFAWEARMYTLGTLLAFLSSWALLRAIRREPQAAAPWLLYGVLGVLFAYVHYYALFTIVAHLVFVAGYLLVTTRGRIGEIGQSRRLWYGLLAAVVAGVLYAPWIPTLLRQNSQVQEAYWIPPLGGWSIPDTFYRMFFPTAGIPPHSGVGWILLAALPLIFTVSIWFLLLKAHSRNHKTADADWLVVVAATVPFLSSISLSLFTQSLYQDRFFVFAHLFILTAAAMLIWRVPSRLFRGVVTAVIVIGFLAAFGQYWQELNIPQKPGAHAAAQAVFTQAGAEEPVIVSSPFIYFAILHYAQEEYATKEMPHLYSETGELAHFAGGPILKIEDSIGPDIFTTASPTLWVVDTTGFGATPLIPPAPWRATQVQTYPEVFSHQGVVTVTKYER